METREIRPSTLVGVKRLASQLRKNGDLKHTQALEIASRAAGCENYRHALRILPSALERASRYVLVTVYWIEGNTRYGRETLRVELGKPLSDLCSKAELKQLRGFGHDVRLVADDHIVHDRLRPSQDSARRMACMGARSLQFMEHTGLRPCQRPPVDLVNGEVKLPGVDHATDWMDPTTGQYIFVDEPYGGDEAKRRAWAEHHNWQIARSSWAGMYFPRHADLWLASPTNDRFNLAKLVAKIDALADPLTEENWTGESVADHAVFVSPGANSPQDRRRARAKDLIARRPTATSLPYQSMFGSRRRRPIGTMTVEDHVEMGRIIKTVLASSGLPYGAHNRLNSVRSTLEDWMALELRPGQLDGPEFFDVYYREPDDYGPFMEAAKTRFGQLDLLAQLSRRLIDRYANCPPLRTQLQKVSRAALMIERAR